MVRQEQSAKKSLKTKTNSLKQLYCLNISSGAKIISEWSHWIGEKTKEIIGKVEKVLFDGPAEDDLQFMKSQICALQRQVESLGQQPKQSLFSSSADNVNPTNTSGITSTGAKISHDCLPLQYQTTFSSAIKGSTDGILQPSGLVEKGLKLLELCESMELGELKDNGDEVSNQSNPITSSIGDASCSIINLSNNITHSQGRHYSFNQQFNSSKRSVPRSSDIPVGDTKLNSSYDQHSHSNLKALSKSHALYSSDRIQTISIAYQTSKTNDNKNSNKRPSLEMSLSHRAALVHSAKSNGARFSGNVRHSITEGEARLLKDVSNLINSNSGSLHEQQFSTASQFQPKKLFSSVDVKSVQDQRGRINKLTLT